MGKIVFWIVVIFAVLFVARILSAAARRRAGTPQQGASAPDPKAGPTVRCIRCGVFLPAAEARTVTGGHICGDPACQVQR